MVVSIARVKYVAQGRFPISCASCQFLGLISQFKGKRPPIMSGIHSCGLGHIVSPLLSFAGPTVEYITRLPHIVNSSASELAYPYQIDGALSDTVVQ
jgi:hypothetical protein